MGVARASAAVFSHAYVRALERLAGSAPAFAGIMREPRADDSAETVQNCSDTALLCFAHGYRELDAVETRGGGGGARSAAASTSAPMCGATVGSYRYGYSHVDPFVVLAAVQLPPGGRVEPWCATDGSLPPLHAYPELVRADTSHFLALASPDAPVAALLQRLGSVFPSARIAVGTALSVRARTSSTTLPAQLFSNFASNVDHNTALGFALHLPPSLTGAAAAGGAAAVAAAQQQQQQQQQWVAALDRLIAEAYGSVEFEGVHGFSCSKALEKRLFLVRNIAVGPTRYHLPLPPSPPAPLEATAAAAAPAHAPPPPAAAAPLRPPVIRPLGAAAIHALPPSQPLRPLPLFLMDSLLLPGQRADFRIFEPRYRHMLRRHFEHGELFAVCLPPARIGAYGAEEEEEEGVALEWAPTPLDAPPPTHGATAVAAPAAVATVLGDDAPHRAVPAAAAAPPLRADAAAGCSSRGGGGGGGAVEQQQQQAPSSGGERRVATVVVVRRVHALDADSGRITLQLEGVRRVRVGATWVSPATFGLVHGAATWLDDDAAHSCSVAAAAAVPGAAAAAAAAGDQAPPTPATPPPPARTPTADRLAREAVDVLCGTGLGHVRLRQMLSKSSLRRKGGGSVLVPTPPPPAAAASGGSGGGSGGGADWVLAPTLRPEASPGVALTLASSAAAGGGVGSNAQLAAQLATLSPQALSWWLAELLPVPGSIKQLYLETTSTADRLSRQLAYLRERVGGGGGGAPDEAGASCAASASESGVAPTTGGASGGGGAGGSSSAAEPVSAGQQPDLAA